MYIKAKKSLGQNFLIDHVVLNQIVETVVIKNKDGTNSSIDLKLIQEASKGCDPENKFGSKKSKIFTSE